MTSRILLIPLSWLSLSLLAQEALPKTAETFDVGGHKAFLSAAPMPAEGKPWLWYAPTLKSLAFGERKGYFETFAKAGISIAGYDIGEVRGSPTSTLTQLAIEPSGGKGPQNLLISPDGRWLLCANMPGNNVVVFKIDSASGSITPHGTPVEVPMASCLRWME